MMLSELMKGVKYKGKANECDISNIETNSKKITLNGMFICIKGEKHDGHDYYEQAITNGSIYVVTEKDLDIDNQIIVKDSRKAYAQICSNYFGNSDKKLKIIGVTGTNGKTTITKLIKHVLTESGFKVGLIGTICYEIDNIEIESQYTTPDAYYLHKLFSKMLNAGCEYVVMEVSSHAIMQDRFYGLSFEYSLFSNLSQDHMDYHKDMQEYFECKSKLFSVSKGSGINIDCEYGEILYRNLKIKDNMQELNAITLDEENILKADYFAKDIKCTYDGIDFNCGNLNSQIFNIKLAIPCRYTVSNTLLCISACKYFGISNNAITESLGSFLGVKGRCEIIYSDENNTIICDYAHTPDGLKKLLENFKDYVTGRLIVMFGCGGDRDKSKREKMGNAASKYSDYIILTSDNPRTEDPLGIIKDIEKGINPDMVNYKIIANRSEAIDYGVSILKPKDMLILAGKGHEKYQQLNNKVIEFDEEKIVHNALMKYKKY